MAEADPTPCNNHPAYQDLLAACKRASAGYQTMMVLLDRTLPGWRNNYNFHHGKVQIDEAIAKAAAEAPAKQTVTIEIMAEDSLTFDIEVTPAGLEALEEVAFQAENLAAPFSPTFAVTPHGEKP